MKQHPHPDLLLLDISLSDGLCFEIFKQTNFYKPVIFTTAYDQYAIDAFKMFSIDYIVKPITLEALAAAINKFKNLQSFIPATYSNLIAHWSSKDFKKPYHNNRPHLLMKGHLHRMK